MNQSEARQAAFNGKKISHDSFASYEYIEWFANDFYFHDGNRATNKWWNNIILKEGWKILND